MKACQMQLRLAIEAGRPLAGLLCASCQDPMHAKVVIEAYHNHHMTRVLK